MRKYKTSLEHFRTEISHGTTIADLPKNNTYTQKKRIKTKLNTDMERYWKRQGRNQAKWASMKSMYNELSDEDDSQCNNEDGFAEEENQHNRTQSLSDQDSQSRD